MARDRLAALRAQRQQDGSPQGHEMMALNTPDQLSSPTFTNNTGNGATDPMSDFYTEVTSIMGQIDLLNSNVTRISELHSRSLDSTTDNRQNDAILDELVSQTREISNDVKRRVQAMEAKPPPPGQDARIIKNRTSFARSKFLEALQNYQQVERDYRARYKQRVERQFKIVKPDATPEEVDAVVNDTNGGGDQIFSQALMSSTRYGESRAAYREVQDRHEDIKRIERTLEELAQMFNDMSVLVAQQDEQINTIETTAGRVEQDTEQGLKHTEKAVKSARAARRKRWICFILTLIILAIIGIVVGVEVSKNVKNN